MWMYGGWAMKYPANRSYVFFAVFLSFHILLGISSAQADDNIFDEDNRIAMTSPKYPWSTVGKVYAGGYGCTGTLVGRDLVLTAAHCILDDKTGKLMSGPIEFFPNQIDGQAKMSSQVIVAVYGGAYPEYAYADWAILKIKDPLGDYYGYMGVQSKVDYLPFMVHSVGYSFDFRSGQTAGVHVGCHIRGTENYLFNHDCDQTSGASGGPMFIVRDDKPFIVAIMVSEHRYSADALNEKKQLPYSDATTNHGVSAGHFQPIVSEMRKEPEEPKPIS